MIKVCHNKNSAIYDDGDNWVWKADGENDITHEKKNNPLFPLAAVVKYGMVTDNESIMNELRRNGREVI